MPGVILSQFEMQTMASAQWALTMYSTLSAMSSREGSDVEHAVVAHGDAVVDGDGVEFLGDAAGRLDLAGDELAEVLQVDVAGDELGEGVDDGDDRLAEVAVLHAGGAPQAAGAGHVAAVGGGARAIGGHGRAPFHGLRRRREGTVSRPPAFCPSRARVNPGTEHESRTAAQRGVEGGGRCQGDVARIGGISRVNGEGLAVQSTYIAGTFQVPAERRMPKRKAPCEDKDGDRVNWGERLRAGKGTCRRRRAGAAPGDPPCVEACLFVIGRRASFWTRGLSPGESCAR